MRIALISCGKTKKEGIHKAKDLYGSSRFRLAFLFAQKHYDAVYILSAKHGLLDPDSRIKNYDVSLQHLSPEKRKVWARRAIKQIRKQFSSQATIHFFCGELYRKHIIEGLSEMRCAVPLEGLSIGRQLQWYKEKNKHNYYFSNQTLRSANDNSLDRSTACIKTSNL